jgi:hypothetical protein
LSLQGGKGRWLSTAKGGASKAVVVSEGRVEKARRTDYGVYPYESPRAWLNPHLPKTYKHRLSVEGHPGVRFDFFSDETRRLASHKWGDLVSFDFEVKTKAIPIQDGNGEVKEKQVEFRAIKQDTLKAHNKHGVEIDRSVDYFARAAGNDADADFEGFHMAEGK